MVTYTEEDILLAIEATGLTREQVIKDGLAQSVADSRSEEKRKYQLVDLRSKRNHLLAETDHWAFQDTPDMTEEQRNYRQALRDITENYSSLEEVVWPTKPEV